MTAMVSIDFGNSYTKVAIRRNRKEMSEPVRDGSLNQDDGLKFCIPSLVARVIRGRREHWYYGMQVLQLREDTANMKVFRNWKPAFFQGVEQRLQPNEPVFSATAKSLGQSRKLLAEEEARKISDSLAIPYEKIAAFLREQGIDIGNKRVPFSSTEENLDPEWTREFQVKVGVGFFSWLRTFVEPICQAKGLPDIDRIPVRISLPSFGSHTKAEGLLVEILEQSGWCLDKDFPTLPEPISNSIGIFTEGRNAIWIKKPKPTGFNDKATGKELPSNARMFRESEIFKALRAHLLTGGPKFYWVLGVDLGGYTADCAMLGFDLDEMDVSFDGKWDGKKRLSTFSEPIGVRILDERIRGVLSEAKKDYLTMINGDTDQRRIETFHRIVYDRLQPHPTAKHGTIGQGKELDRIRDCLQAFADEIADYAEEFLEVGQYQQVDALVLTGGGCNIPLVRETLCKRLERYRPSSNYTCTHIPTEAKSKVPAGYHRLNPLLVRGATALGGASVIFDFAKCID